MRLSTEQPTIQLGVPVGPTMFKIRKFVVKQTRATVTRDDLFFLFFFVKDIRFDQTGGFNFDLRIQIRA